MIQKVILLLLLLPGQLHAQILSKDSVFQLTELAWDYLFIDLDTAKMYGHIALNESIKNDYPELEITAHFRLSKVYSKMNLFDSAFYHNDISIKYHYQKQDAFNLSFDFADKGTIYGLAGDYSNELKSEFKALKFAQISGDTLNCLWLLENIANTYGSLKLFHQSKVYYEKVIYLIDNYDLDYFSPVSYTGLARYYESQQDFQSALKFDKKALGVAIMNNRLRPIVTSYSNIGEDYYNLKMNDSALFFSRLGLEKALASKDVVAQMIVLDNHIIFQMEEGEMDSAEYYMSLQENIYEPSMTVKARLKYYKSVIDYYGKTGNDKKVNTALTEYQKLKDSVYSAEVFINIARLEFQKKQDKIEAELIKAKNQRLKSQVEEAKRTNKIVIAIAILVSIFILIFTFILRRNLSIKIKNENLERTQLELKQDILRAQMNPHFIFNCITTAQNLYVKGATNEAHDYLSDLSILLRRVFENSGRTVISLSEELEFIQLYISLETNRIDNSLDVEVVISEDIDQEIKIPAMLLQPIVENAIWHGVNKSRNAGKIFIRIRMEAEEFIIFEIKDNGPGITKDKLEKLWSKKHALSIIKNRLAPKGDIQVNSEEGLGTTVQLKIAINYD